MKRDYLSEDNFKEILKNYSIGSYVSHKKLFWSMENILYQLKTTQGDFILKIFEKEVPEKIKYIFKVMEFCRIRGTPVARIFKTKRGSKILIYNKRPITIQDFIKGKTFKKADKQFIIEFSRVLSKLGSSLSKIKLTGKYVWPSKKQPWEFYPRDFESIRRIGKLDLHKEEEKILSDLNANVNPKKLRRSVIHGDFQSVNLIVSNGKIKAIIDWDYANEDFLAFEVAMALNHLFFTFPKTELENIKYFFEEYERNMPLTQEEKKAIYYFIKEAMLSGIVWCERNRKKNKDKYLKITKWLNETIKSYKSFNKFSLEEFQSLIGY